jgi:DNA-binding NarL/FixJ family response regulator
MSENAEKFGRTDGTIRVLIATDQPVVGLGLKHVLQAAQDIRVSAVVSSLCEALERLGSLESDLMLLDLGTRDAGHADARAALAGVAPSVKLIAYSACEDVERVMQAVHLGMQGFVPKCATAQEIIHAIRTVHAGDVFLEPRIAGQVLRHMGTSVMARADRKLSARELQVLRELSQDNSNGAVAEKLAISEFTVRSHVRSIARKLNARSRSEAIRIATTRGLLRRLAG